MTTHVRVNQATYDRLRKLQLLLETRGQRISRGEVLDAALTALESTIAASTVFCRDCGVQTHSVIRIVETTTKEAPTNNKHAPGCRC